MARNSILARLYIEGAFGQGGSDIVRELNASGDLQRLLEESGLLV
jgi:glutaredoxin-related protein